MVFKILVALLLPLFLRTMAQASVRGVTRCGECNCLVEDSATNTLNCSRRGLHQVPRWSSDLEIFSPDQNVFVNFYNNSIKNIDGLPNISGKSVLVSFKYNQIEEIEDDAFQSINNMLYLDLSNNLLTGAALRSEVFRGPFREGTYDGIALETLNLAHNHLHSLDNRLFEFTPSLKRLYLNDNPFEMLDQVTVLAISSTVNMEVLDISNIQIDSIPVDTFRGLSKLQQLNLSGNRFASIPGSLAVLGPSLQYLTFNNNPITELNDDSFVGLRSLKELEVSENTELEEVRRSTFTPLRSLRVLHLCHNRNLRHISHNAFRELKKGWNLDEVYLDDNDLSELPTDLLPWSKLRVLGLTGNNWLCNCDLANIVSGQGAGDKFLQSDTPTCIAPMRLSGTYITKIPVDHCPEHSQKSQRNLFILTMKHKYIVWAVISVSMVILIGTALGLGVNFAKSMMHRCPSHETIRYVNIKSPQHV